MDESRNVEILRKAYELWHESRADSAERWLDLMADDVRWGSIGEGHEALSFASSGVGRATVAAYMEALTSAYELLEYRIDEFIAQGDRVVALGACRWRTRSTGVEVATAKADVFRFRDGKVTEFFEFFDTAKAVAAS